MQATQASATTRLLGFIVIAGLAASGCATTPPYREPFAAKPLAVDPARGLAVDRMFILFDASGSIDPQTIFPGEKAWVESFVQGMPEGDYDATIRGFGGSRRSGSSLSPFDRTRLAADANALGFIGEDSPLDVALAEIGDEIEGAGGRTAVIVVTDGVPNPPAYGGPAEPVLEAGRGVIARSGGTVCYHTVLAGDGEDGRALLEALAALSPCGSARSSSSISDANALGAFQGDVFLAAVVAAAPIEIDSDGDGVVDSQDACPGTPVGAAVDGRGCWVLEGVRFGSDSAEIVSGGEAAIASIAEVLNRNPEMRVQIVGFTDSTGSAQYNQRLSERRAETVERHLIESGIEAERLEAVGRGEENPIADNDTAAGRARNRRIEFTVLR